eukprot:SAG31_NODE_2942_length_4878_cov_6.517263_4_plen_69_part_00
MHEKAQRRHGHVDVTRATHPSTFKDIKTSSMHMAVVHTQLGPERGVTLDMLMRLMHDFEEPQHLPNRR